MDFEFFPFFLVAAICIVSAIVVLVAAVRMRLLRDRVLFGLVAVLLLAVGVFFSQPVFPQLFDRRIAAYQRFYRAIDEGMTRAEVLETRDRLYPEGDTRQPPVVMEDVPRSLGFFMNSEGEVEPNCEGIFLDLENGRVVRKRYSRD